MITVLYIDFALSGHHVPYLKTVLANSGNDQKSILVLPKRPSGFETYVVFELGPFKHRDFLDYIRWIKEIKRIIRRVNPDIIHFLSGDELYPFFGYARSHFL